MIVGRLTNWPEWGWRSPFDELERIRREMDRLTQGLAQGWLRERGAGVFPLVNITEDADRYYVRAELPGVKADDLDLSATANSITISGERKITDESNNARYHRRERDAGRFSRIITLPDRINADGIDATCNNGVLTITVPKAEESKPRQISVKSS
jgi:HSP20 family protein